MIPPSPPSTKTKPLHDIIKKIPSHRIGALDNGFFSGIRVGDSMQVMISHLLYADDVINLHKCSLLGVGVEFDEVRRVAGLIGCEPVKPPFKYLGVLVGSLMSRLRSWEVVVDKVVARLSKWKVKTLSIGGRLTLLKSVIHGSQGKLNSTSLPSHSSTWLDLIKCTNQLEEKGVHLLSNCKKKVGDGIDTSYSCDVWLGDINLKSIFPRLFALESNKEVCVHDKVNEGLAYSFRRLPRGGVESYQMESLLSLLLSSLASSMSDRWIWALDGMGEFSVASVRSYIEDNLFG
ncbi:hypothetical protein Tco_0422174 [Tanacetum coccineum]